MTADRRIALATCAGVPGGDPDDHLLVAPLAAHGVTAEFVTWDDPAVDWAAFDLVVVRSTWDYPTRREEFLDWARSVPRLANPAAVIAANTDKHYLGDLAAAGLPVVPTAFVDDVTDLPAALAGGGTVVVKPVVGAGSKDTGRYDLDRADDRAAAAALAERILDGGRGVVVQPYLHAIDIHGETALMHVEGCFGHAVRKAPLLAGPAPDVPGLYVEERITPTRSTEAQRSLAAQALAALVPGEPPLYARVDVLPGADGEPVLLEVELAEPSLFLGHGPATALRLADAIADRVRVGVV